MFKFFRIFDLVKLITNEIFFISKDQRLRARRQVLQEDDVDGSMRPIRSTRQTLNRSNGTVNQDTDDDSDDDQLLSQIASQNRPKRSPRGSASAPLTTEFVDTTSPVHENGHFLTRTRDKIRRKQISISTNSTTTASTVTSNSSSQSTLTRSMTISETTSQIERRRNQVSLFEYDA